MGSRVESRLGHADDTFATVGRFSAVLPLRILSPPLGTASRADDPPPAPTAAATAFDAVNFLENVRHFPHLVRGVGGE